MSKSFYIIYFSPSYAELYYCALKETVNFIIDYLIIYKKKTILKYNMKVTESN